MKRLVHGKAIDRPPGSNRTFAFSGPERATVAAALAVVFNTDPLPCGAGLRFLRGDALLALVEEFTVDPVDSRDMAHG